MNFPISKTRLLAVAGFLSILFIACQKDSISGDSSSSEDNSEFIAIAATLAADPSSTTDSIYVLHSCRGGKTRDSIGYDNLPSQIKDYITSNYENAVFSKAYSVKDSNGNISEYAVVIYYNNNPVALLFNSSGSFVRVLEQREKSDLHGKGWHHGGRFQGRGGHGNDSLSLASLPSSVTEYISSNYSSDTLVKAFQQRDSTILVISKNNGLFATVFSAEGSFIKRAELPAKHKNGEEVEQNALPSNVLEYLNTTYPNYVFKRGFVLKNAYETTGWLVLIEANSTQYAIGFDASGNFVKATVLY